MLVLAAVMAMPAGNPFGYVQAGQPAQVQRRMERLPQRLPERATPPPNFGGWVRPPVEGPFTPGAALSPEGEAAMRKTLFGMPEGTLRRMMASLLIQGENEPRTAALEKFLQENSVDRNTFVDMLVDLVKRSQPSGEAM